MIDEKLIAADVRRGVIRLFAAQGLVAIPEVALPNGRRTDITAINAKGQISIVEIKVSRADLHGDAKWPDYMEWCDRFFWALPAGLNADILETEAYRPDRSGYIVADRYEAAIVREAAVTPLPAARRKAEWLRLARIAMRRQMFTADSDVLMPLTDF